MVTLVKKILIIVLVFSGPVISGQEHSELPAAKPREEIVKHECYTLSFVEGYSAVDIKITVSRAESK